MIVGTVEEESIAAMASSVVAQKGEPALRKFRISGRFAHPARDGSLGHIKSQHEKLAVDARCCPGGILGDHLKDQIPNLFRSAFSADLATEPGNQTPIELKPSLVPANDRCPEER